MQPGSAVLGNSATPILATTAVPAQALQLLFLSQARLRLYLLEQLLGHAGLQGVNLCQQNVHLLLCIA